MKNLILIRGLPGSGKSTLANTLHHFYSTIKNFATEWVEADQYFIRNGQYQFNPHELHEAHGWCQQRAVQAMQLQCPVIIVSNTFTRLWEMQSYVDAAKAHGYTVQVLHCEGQFDNVHLVPQTSIESMKKRWEPYVS